MTLTHHSDSLRGRQSIAHLETHLCLLAHYNAELFIFTCSSPIDIPVIMCEVGQGFHFPCLFLLFSPSVCSHYILFQQSPIPSLPCCCSPFFCHSFKVSVQTYHCNVSLPHLFPPHSAHTLSLCLFFIVHSVHKTSLFQPTPHQFLV